MQAFLNTVCHFRVCSGSLQNQLVSVKFCPFKIVQDVIQLHLYAKSKVANEILYETLFAVPTMNQTNSCQSSGYNSWVVMLPLPQRYSLNI